MDELTVILTVAEWKKTIDAAAILVEKIKVLMSQNCCPIEEGKRYFDKCSQTLSKLNTVVDSLKRKMGYPELIIPQGEDLVKELDALIPVIEEYVQKYAVDKNANR